MAGISETKEVLAYVDALIDEAIKAKADDGKIDTAEIISALTVTAPEGVSAVIGSWNVPEELGELDAAEKDELVGLAMPILMKLIGVFL